MRERIVQVAGDFQALAHDRRIARLFRQPLHFARAHGHAPFELAAEALKLAALSLKIAENRGERSGQLRHLVDARRNLDLGRFALPDGCDGTGQALQPAGELPRTQHPEQGRRSAEAHRHPQDFERQRVRALIDALVGLGELDLPTQCRDFVACAQQRSGDEHVPSVGQAFEFGRAVRLRRSRRWERRSTACCAACRVRRAPRRRGRERTPVPHHKDRIRR